MPMAAPMEALGESLWCWAVNAATASLIVIPILLLYTCKSFSANFSMSDSAAQLLSGGEDTLMPCADAAHLLEKLGVPPDSKGATVVLHGPERTGKSSLGNMLAGATWEVACLDDARPFQVSSRSDVCTRGVFGVFRNGMLIMDTEGTGSMSKAFSLQLLHAVAAAGTVAVLFSDTTAQAQLLQRARELLQSRAGAHSQPIHVVFVCANYALESTEEELLARLLHDEEGTSDAVTHRNDTRHELQRQATVEIWTLPFFAADGGEALPAKVRQLVDHLHELASQPEQQGLVSDSVKRLVDAASDSSAQGEIRRSALLVDDRFQRQIEECIRKAEGHVQQQCTTMLSIPDDGSIDLDALVHPSQLKSDLTKLVEQEYQSVAQELDHLPPEIVEDASARLHESLEIKLQEWPTLVDEHTVQVAQALQRLVRAQGPAVVQAEARRLNQELQRKCSSYYSGYTNWSAMLSQLVENARQAFGRCLTDSTQVGPFLRVLQRDYGQDTSELCRTLTSAAMQAFQQTAGSRIASLQQQQRAAELERQRQQQEAARRAAEEERLRQQRLREQEAALREQQERERREAARREQERREAEARLERERQAELARLEQQRRAEEERARQARRENALRIITENARALHRQLDSAASDILNADLAVREIQEAARVMYGMGETVIERYQRDAQCNAIDDPSWLRHLTENVQEEVGGRCRELRGMGRQNADAIRQHRAQQRQRQNVMLMMALSGRGQFFIG